MRKIIFTIMLVLTAFIAVSCDEGVPAPVITGVDDVTVYVSVLGNPPSFDPSAGVEATNHLGADIPWGDNLYIKEIESPLGTVVTEINYYQAGTYYITYEAVDPDSGKKATATRELELIIPEFDTNHTDALRLEEPYEGLSFINDRIGEVKLRSFVDGDTTNFYDSVSGTYVTVRYMGIDTPEATSKFDPWGIKAASFVRDRLSEASRIILQAEPTGDRTDGNDRYLAWVWYVYQGETRLLNLELVEQAYAWVSSASSTQYGDIFSVAGAETQLTGLRIYGEQDPDYDYSREGDPVSIGELLDQFETYYAKKVTVSGVITAKIGYSIYLEQDGRGIYLYTGYNPTNELQIGHQVTIQGLVPAYYPADTTTGKQLTNYYEYNMILESEDNPVVVTTINGSQIADYVGRVVRFENLTVMSVDEAPSSNAFNVYAEDEFGNEVNLRVDNFTATFVSKGWFPVGRTIAWVQGPVSMFYDDYQVMIAGQAIIEFED
ncbi:MAG: thermonuclease family protein [Acholeplasmataceae bacterium]|nr:thermonuclease family protein [Acholeplasmataceae bacterium]